MNITMFASFALLAGAVSSPLALADKVNSNNPEMLWPDKCPRLPELSENSHDAYIEAEMAFVEKDFLKAIDITSRMLREDDLSVCSANAVARFRIVSLIAQYRVEQGMDDGVITIKPRAY